MFDFLKILIQFFEQNNVPYMLSGSVAMSIYTLPRFTRDFDFIVHLELKDVPVLMTEFKTGYYCDENAVRDAITNKSMFNIIEHKSSYKADFIILKKGPYRQNEFERRRRIDFENMKIFVVSPEDLLLSKMIWIQELQSNIQIEDIKVLLELNALDRNYIHYWIKTLNLNTFGLLNK